MLLTGLMGYDRARVAPKARQRRRHNIVERAGTQAATDDKHAQWPPARLITLFNRLDPHHGGPDWITYHQRSRHSPGETRQAFSGNSGQQAVGVTGPSVLLLAPHRNA